MSTITNTTKKNKKFVLTDEQINLLKEAFDLFDMEKTGKIDYHELKLTFKAFGFKVTKEEMKLFKERLDPNSNNKLTFDGFLRINCISTTYDTVNGSGYTELHYKMKLKESENTQEQIAVLII